ncbi:6024_t:CDS:2 [Gigaspora rosea]|nr:6024_t:CDS:2 [Gigaspora rosea]
MKLDQISSYCDKYPQEASNLSQVYLDLTTAKSWVEVKVKDIEPLQRCILLGRTSKNKHLHSITLAIAFPDSTVVYYKVHDGINPPSDN